MRPAPCGLLTAFVSWFSLARRSWSGIKSLDFNEAGTMKTPWGTGKWGLAQRPKGLPLCQPPAECLFVDFSGAAHHVRFELPDKFFSVRVGDGEQVTGTRIKD